MCMNEAVEIWLVTTDHLEDGLWFPKESDYCVGMNLVAALAAELPVFVLAFVLMSNHVHFAFWRRRPMRSALSMSSNGGIPSIFTSDTVSLSY